MPKYNPEITASIAARAARKLFAIEGRKKEEKKGIPNAGIPKESIPTIGIPRDGIPTISIPERDFCRFHNWVFDWLPQKLTMPEWVVYVHLYRLAVGYNTNRCTIGYSKLATRTCLARSTVNIAIKNLIDKGYLQAIEQSQQGTTFLLTIPTDGIPGISIPGNSIPTDDTPTKNPEISAKNEGIPIDGIPRVGPIKDNNIDNNKDNNKELLLTFFDQTPFEPVTPEALEFLSQYEYDTVVRCAKAVLAWPNTRNPMALLRAALKEGYRFPEGKRDSKEDSEIRKLIEEQARKAEEEEGAFLRFKESLPASEKENIAKRVRESLADDPFYRRIKSTEMMKKYADGKLEGELRKMFAQLEHK